MAFWKKEPGYSRPWPEAVTVPAMSNRPLPPESETVPRVRRRVTVRPFSPGYVQEAPGLRAAAPPSTSASSTHRPAASVRTRSESVPSETRKVSETGEA